MAVHAQYPSDVLLIERAQQGRKDAAASKSFAAMDSADALFSRAVSGHPRKRMRDAVPPPAPAPQQTAFVDLFTHPASLQTPYINLADFHKPSPAQTNQLVSTGLRLAFGEPQNQSHVAPTVSVPTPLSSSLPDELNAHLQQHKDDIDRLFLEQGDQLRRSLTDQWRRYCRSLSHAAEEVASRKLREKDAELARAVRRGAELEQLLARSQAESMAWHAKALAAQTAAATLHTQLQTAMAAREARACDESGAESGPVESAESAHIDPVRSAETNSRACRVCHSSPASVVVLPCRHLSMCEGCADAAGGDMACPACGGGRGGSVRVFLC